ncbi:MAG: hypothetical protein V4710_01230 [Verrucomicrobiota bacterium]
MKVAPEVFRVLSVGVTYKGQKREVTATLAHGDRLVLTLEEFGEVGSLSVMELFWTAIRTNPGMQKHRLQPRTCRQRIGPKIPGKVPDTTYAREYGVSRGTVAKWRKAGAPLSNPDKMGDYIFALPKRGGEKQRKRVLA